MSAPTPEPPPPAAEVGFPDVEEMLRLLLDPLAPGRVDSERPADLAEQLPFVQAYRFGGGDDGLTDYPSVAVDVFAARREDADGVQGGRPLAEQCRQALLRAREGTVGAGSGIDAATTISGPREVPYGTSSGVRLWTATYRLEVRRTRL